MSESRKRRQNAGARSRTGSSENNHRHERGNSRSKMNHSSGGKSSKPGFQRQGSYDRVRKIVQEEGRTARNLIQFNVPVEDEETHTPRKHKAGRSAGQKSRSSSAGHKPPSRDGSLDGAKSEMKDFRRRSSQSSLGKRGGDLRARYWAYLFENLRRAVDEIYQTCETDESVVECKEVIMMLEQCTKDFKSLIERLNLLKAYESAEEGSRPTSLAWEVRKSSPGKGLSAVGGKENIAPSPSVSRSLNFTSSQSAGLSWADRVKGSSPAPQLQEPTLTSGVPVTTLHQSAHVPSTLDNSSTMDDDDESEGWETVQRGGRTKVKNLSHSSSMNSTLNAKSSPNYHRLPDNGNHQPMSVPPPAKTSSPVDKSDVSNDSKSSEKISIATEKTIASPGSKENHPPGFLPKAENINLQNVDSWIDKDHGWHNLQKEGLGRLSEEFSSDDEKDDGDDDDMDDDEDMQSRLDDALESAINAESDLCYQLQLEQNEALKTAILEEQEYLQQIQREENTIIEVETEPDTESELGTTHGSDCLSSHPRDYAMAMKAYEMTQMSWGDIMDVEQEKRESRTPGRVVHIHEKLSSPSRKRSPTESRKRHEEKQAKAQEQREKLMTEKAERLKMLTSKVEEVRAWKEELLQHRRVTIEGKMQRAEEKRRWQLKQKVRKAHEEENKANEIAFINTLEAQNKRHDIIAKHQESEARLQDIQEERQRRHEEKAAKEAAVEERRKALEAERQARLVEMQQRRKQRVDEFEHRQQEREKERLETARMKEKEREERMASLNAQHQAHKEELQKKIKFKHDEGTRRHRENLDLIREKAFEMSILKHSTENHNDAPKPVPYESKKYCTVCCVMIPSEVYLLSHLHGKKHKQALAATNGGKELSSKEIEDFNLKHIADAPSDETDPRVTCDKERQKALKKRCKKLRQRMTQRGLEYENSLTGKPQSLEAEHRAKLQKLVKDLQKYVNSQDRGPWPQNKVSALDRALGEVARIMDKKFLSDQNYFRMCGGLSSLSSLLDVINQSNWETGPVIPVKSLVHACTVFRLACKGGYDNCHYLLFANRMGSLVDLLSHQLHLLIPENFDVQPSQDLPHKPLASALMQLCASLLSVLAKQRPMPASPASAARTAATPDAFASRANDMVSYTVCLGVVDRLSSYFSAVRSSVDEEPQVADFLQHAMGLLTAVTRLATKRMGTCFDVKKCEDPTQLIHTFQTTNLVGIVSLLYGTLLHAGGIKDGTEAAILPHHTITMTTLAVRLLNHVALLDLEMLQRVLGEEGTWLELRHMCSYLLRYCSQQSCPELLHEVIICIGYFTVLNHDNQNVIQSGQPPSVLQQLCSLPFQYFSNPRLTCILFPTLITCSYLNDANRDILQQELSCDLLANFIEEKQLEAQQATLTPSPNMNSSKKGKQAGSMQTNRSSSVFDDREVERISLAQRFPVEDWAKAQDYFKGVPTADY